MFQGEPVSLEPIVGPVLIEMNEQDEGVEVAQVHGEHQAPYPPDKRIVYEGKKSNDWQTLARMNSIYPEGEFQFSTLEGLRDSRVNHRPSQKVFPTKFSLF